MTDHFKSRTKRYAIVLLRGMIIAAFVFGTVAATGLYITNNVLDKVYSATAVIEVQPQQLSPQAYSGWSFSSPQSRAVAAEFERIESPEVLQLVVANLGLDRVWAERLFKSGTPLTMDETIHDLLPRIRLNYKHEKNVIEIIASSDDPKEASQIANSLATEYQVERDEQTASALKTHSVHILALASTPDQPSHPNRRFCYAVTAAIAGMLSVMIASAVEVCMLIARAEESAGEMRPVS